MENRNLQEIFSDFIDEYKQDFDSEYVDYLGIDISATEDSDPIFKIYYNNMVSRYETHPLINFLEEMNMVRYVTMVRDKKNPSKARYDVGLKHRTNINMFSVFEWLSNNTEMYDQYSDEIIRLSQMKVTDKEGYDYAGLYFLGFISENQDISVLKCHYFNRICDNPDVLHKNIQYADKYYLSYLKDSGICYFANLTVLLQDILRYCGGHLWMTGTDYEEQCGNRKYKIYIKNPKVVYDGLLNVFSSHIFANLQKQLLDLKDWNNQHQEFYCEGFAICENENEVISINFYYVQR